jgi:hypothetical protein
MIGMDHIRHRLCHGQRGRAGAFEIEIQLGVGIVWDKVRSHFESQGSFADPSHAIQTAQWHPFLDDRGEERGQFHRTACKVAWGGWDLMEGRHGRHGRNQRSASDGLTSALRLQIPLEPGPQRDEREAVSRALGQRRRHDRL